MGPPAHSSSVCLCPVSPSQARFLITWSCVGLGVPREVSSPGVTAEPVQLCLPGLVPLAVLGSL